MDKACVLDNESDLSKFSNFGELLFYSYANLQMLHFALSAQKQKYDKACFMIRSKAFKSQLDIYPNKVSSTSGFLNTI